MTYKSEVIKDYRYREVLDHGFIGLVDAMPGVPYEHQYKLLPTFGEGDAAIVQAARVSYGKGTKAISNTRGLIRYLMRHRHNTPFEMVEFKFHCKMPIFVARQWVRHRTANINEYSARYSEMTDEFYIPKAENIKPQSSSNKQGRDENAVLSDKDISTVQEFIADNNDNTYYNYSTLLANQEFDDAGAFPREDETYFPGISRELARMVLPLNNYTEWFWKIDLHNLLHFISLRADSHAQWEIQEYARAMTELITPLVPIVLEAFTDYKIEGTTVSRIEKEIIKHALTAHHEHYPYSIEWLKTMGFNNREAEEFLNKFDIEIKKE